MVGTVTTLLFTPHLYSVIGKFERRRAGSFPRSERIIGRCKEPDVQNRLKVLQVPLCAVNRRSGIKTS